MQKQKSLICWIKNHKAELIIAGFSVGTLVLIILGIKNQEMLKSIWESLQKSIKRPSIKIAEENTVVVVEASQDVLEKAIPSTLETTERLPFEVSKHIRNLPIGRQASAEKIASAPDFGFELMDGQTWVTSYMKGGAVA